MKTLLFRHLVLLLAPFVLGQGSMLAQAPFSTDTFITPTSIQVHAGEVAQFKVMRNGVPATNGYWYSNGVGQAGWINSTGLYMANWEMTANPQITIGYFMGTSRAETTITITNPIPKPQGINVSSFTQISTPIMINGYNFVPGTTIYVQGRAMPTTLLDTNHVTATVVLSAPVSGNVAVVVQNPNPGASNATINIPAVFPTVGTILPAKVSSGWVSLSLAGTGYTPNSVVLMDGRPMVTTLNSATSMTATGYLPSWRNQTSTKITVLPQTGSAASVTKTLPVSNPALSYDAAARLSTQAAFGPRPGLVEHIQQVGMKGFLTEQIALPGVTYTPPTLPRYPFLEAVSSGSSLLRLRVATALSSFIVNQATSDEYAAYAPWEMTLEKDCLGNFRQLMTDIASDPRLTETLDLPGNNVSSDPTLHPNQNFAREFMQLFTIGTSMLNDDGSAKMANGQVVPTYDQNTILDLSRALTGWNYGPVVNQQFVSWGIDFSSPLAPFDQNHDHGAKTLFGTVHLSGGQSITADRTAALDAIFNHPNVPAFIATRLIGQMVTSNPSPAYVQRISNVFKNNGKGVRGDMAAVVTAILLDPEARAGDTEATVGVNEGVLQDPLAFVTSGMNVLQQTQWDGEPTYVPGQLGMEFWHASSVFGFYPATAAIPGTTINSPQFRLFNNLTQYQRSEYLYGMITGTTSGFTNQYMRVSWLFNAFTNIPDLVDGLNHQLFHGKMPAATQSEILNYCSGIPNQQQAFVAAIFLAMNSDSYNVTH